MVALISNKKFNRRYKIPLTDTMHMATEVCNRVCDTLAAYPAHIRSNLAEILKTGEVNADILNGNDIHYYLPVCKNSPSLKKACEGKFLDHLNRSNCIEALNIAAQFEFLTLKKESLECLVNNFENLWKTENFQHMSENVMDCLCNVEKICRHKEIFHALQYWLSFDHEKRIGKYARILEAIRQRRTINRQTSCSTKYAAYHAMLMCSCNKDKTTISTAVFNCDGETVCHRNLFKSNDIKEDVSVTCVQNDEFDAPYVYIGSGKHVFRYDPMLNKQTKCDNLINARCQSNLIAHDDFVYAIGGQQGGKPVLDIEEHNTKCKSKLKTKQWKVTAKLPEDINFLSAPCISYKDKIYIIGDRISEPSTVVVSFCPTEKSVQVAAEFPKQCSDCRAVCHGSDIYISSTEGYFLKFDTNTCIFTSCQDITDRVKNACMYLHGDYVYLICGEDSLTKYEYDITTNSWKSVKNFNIASNIIGFCDMKVPLSYTNFVPFREDRKGYKGGK